jgi:hypothetical protein
MACNLKRATCPVNTTNFLLGAFLLPASSRTSNHTVSCAAIASFTVLRSSPQPGSLAMRIRPARNDSATNNPSAAINKGSQSRCRASTSSAVKRPGS